MDQEVQPNVLYVFADQLSMLALNIYGTHNKVNTPNIDYLAKNGVKFTRSYCTTPQCSPSRSSILTGLYPHKTGVVGNIGTKNTQNLNPQLTNIGSFLNRRGYRTGYFGKWHLGSPIESFGFDDCQEYDRGNDESTTRDALQFLDIRDEKPWIAIVSYDNPHDIYMIEEIMQTNAELETSSIELPVSFGDDLSTKPAVQSLFRDEDQGKPLVWFKDDDWKNYIAYYNQLIESIDRELGILLNKIRETGQLENTIVIFSSDHGDLMGAHRCPYKGPMMYDELIKVPFIVCYPATLPVGESRDQFMMNTDIFPTICDLLGFELSDKIDGISMKNCILDQSAKSRDHVVIQYYSKQDWINPIRTIIDDHYKYSLCLNGEEELYSVPNLDGETVNLAQNDQFLQEKERLKKTLVNWLEKEIDPFFSCYNTDRKGNILNEEDHYELRQ